MKMSNKYSVVELKFNIKTKIKYKAWVLDSRLVLLPSVLPIRFIIIVDFKTVINHIKKRFWPEFGLSKN